MWFRNVFTGVFCLLALASCPSNDTAIPRDDAGFVTIEPVAFTFSNATETLALRSSRTHIFYAFQAADSAPESKPLAVFFNGGPGSATCSGLWTMNTGRETLIEGEGGDIVAVPAHDNPNSWTSIANLLWVDARGTGFSYGETENAYDSGVRGSEFNAHNYNAWLDAADFVRVLLAVFDRIPALRDNPVIVVGESYGGQRGPMMLHLVQHYARYADGGMPYQDPTLVQALQRHYECLFSGGRKCGIFSPETIAWQFGRQVLIQPLVCAAYTDMEMTPMEAAGGPIETIEAETGVLIAPYIAQYGNTLEALDYYLQDANRDIYNYSKPLGWTDGFFTSAADDLVNESEFELLSGVPWDSVKPFLPENRVNAYRTIAPVPEHEGESQSADLFQERQPHFRALEKMSPAFRTFYRHLRHAAEMTRKSGETDGLPAWDALFLAFSDDIIDVFYANTLTEQFEMPAAGLEDPLFGRMFLETLTHTKTFITNAADRKSGV